MQTHETENLITENYDGRPDDVHASRMAALGANSEPASLKCKDEVLDLEDMNETENSVRLAKRRIGNLNTSRLSRFMKPVSDSFSENPS